MLAGASLAAFVGFCIHFPARPARAPSASAARVVAAEASMTGARLWRDTLSLLQSRGYVALTVAYSLVVGLSNCLSALVPSNILPLGGTQVDAAWMSAAGNGASLLVGIALAAASDELKRRSGRGGPRALLVSMLTLTGLGYSLYAACVQGAITLPAGRTRLWLPASGYVIAQTALGAFIPLAFDAAAEQNFATDVPDGVTLMLITTVMNFTSGIFLFVPARSFFVFANWSVIAVSFLTAVHVGLALPATSLKYEFDMKEAAAADADSAADRTAESLNI